MILSVNDVRFSYKSRPVLNRVSFALKRNELLAILGPNGVGKTTLLKCINAVLRPQGGTILVADRDLLSLSRMEIARDIGYVAQRTETGRLTAFDAILLGRRPHIRWKVGKEDLKKVDAIIRTFGLEDLSLRFLDEMSGGELQKISIARALVQEPEVLLLDEPTSSLDLKNQQEILETIRHIVTGHGMAGIMTMHDLNSALRFADKVLFMRNGEIYSASGRSEVTPEVVEAVYGLPVTIEKVHGHPVVMPL
jgi:iron complex transport system ATP-binding protein